MKKAFGIALTTLIILLPFSCQQLFTTSLASALAQKPKPVTVTTAAAAQDLAAQALESGDAEVAAAALESINTLINSGNVTGTELVELRATAGEVAVQTSNITEAIVDILPLAQDLMASGGTLPSEAQTAAIVESLQQVDLSATATSSLMALQSLPVGTVEPEQLAYAGLALVINETKDIDLATLDQATYDQMKLDNPAFATGIALINSAQSQMTTKNELLEEFAQMFEPATTP